MTRCPLDPLMLPKLVIKCSMQAIEDEQHFLFDCPCYSIIRGQHFLLFGPNYQQQDIRLFIEQNSHQLGSVATCTVLSNQDV